MKSLNSVQLIGHLGKDVELRYTTGGDAVANFSMATSEEWKGKDGEKHEKTEWTNIVAWRKLGEICGEYLKKGSRCYVEGKLQTRSWEDKQGNKKYTTEVVINNMIMLDGKPKAQAPPKEEKLDLEDDIPF